MRTLHVRDCVLKKPQNPTEQQKPPQNQAHFPNSKET